jgi:NAD+ synthase
MYKNFEIMNNLPTIDVEKETEKIVSFLKQTLREQNKKKIILGMSGGVDSTTVFYLLSRAVAPENILIIHSYYFQSKLKDFRSILEEAKIPSENIIELSIKNTVLEIKKRLNLSDEDRIRLGNVIARTRMIALYDLAKKNNALVLGTEDKSEFLLGYFTRFGDEASDIEPIRHLYKTQVYTLAKYLGVPQAIINQKASPELWIGQTAKKELGFSYTEADIVLHLYRDRKMKIEKIEAMGFSNAKKIISRVRENSFKRNLPYTPWPFKLRVKPEWN